MKRKLFALVCLVLGIVLNIGYLIIPAAADDLAVSATVIQYGQLTLSPASIDFGSVNPGSTQTTMETVTVQTNSNSWNLTQKQTADTSSGQIAYNWRTHNVGSYAAIDTGAGDTLKSNGSATAGDAIQLDYQLVIPWTIAPATYNATIQYTLSL